MKNISKHTKKNLKKIKISMKKMIHIKKYTNMRWNISWNEKKKNSYGTFSYSNKIKISISITNTVLTIVECIFFFIWLFRIFFSYIIWIPIPRCSNFNAASSSRVSFFFSLLSLSEFFFSYHHHHHYQ